MSENNAEIVRRFYSDLIGHARLHLAGDLFAPGYVDHALSPDQPGSHATLSWLQSFDHAFPNRAIVLEEIAGEGDHVSVRWSGSFTHSRAFLGFPPTGQTLDVSGIGVFRVEDGKIAERWDHEDRPGLMRQLTLLTAQADHLRALEEYGSVTLEAAAGLR